MRSLGWLRDGFSFDSTERRACRDPGSFTVAIGAREHPTINPKMRSLVSQYPADICTVICTPNFSESSGGGWRRSWRTAGCLRACSWSTRSDLEGSVLAFPLLSAFHEAHAVRATARALHPSVGPADVRQVVVADLLFREMDYCFLWSVVGVCHGHCSILHRAACASAAVLINCVQTIRLWESCQPRRPSSG